MTWDLGLVGLGVLLALSIGFGVIAQLMFWGRRSRWAGIVAGASFLVLGLLVSEGWFGWATAEELQPNIDGLSFDEVLIAFLVGIPILLVARWVAGRRDHPSGTPRGQAGHPA